ncbi:MAG TPA: hypothetical protein VJJ20_02365 [Candidatus Paceibacterota bacterium]
MYDELDPEMLMEDDLENAPTGEEKDEEEEEEEEEEPGLDEEEEAI